MSCMSCLEWSVSQDPCNRCCITCELNILCLWPRGKLHHVQHMHDHIDAADILHTVPSRFCIMARKAFITATLSSTYLIPCVALFSTESSYIYWASEDLLNSNMIVESQTKLQGQSGRLVTLCYGAQQSRPAERVLKAQLQPFQQMHIYDF